MSNQLFTIINYNNLQSISHNFSHLKFHHNPLVPRATSEDYNSPLEREPPFHILQPAKSFPVSILNRHWCHQISLTYCIKHPWRQRRWLTSHNAIKFSLHHHCCHWFDAQFFNSWLFVKNPKSENERLVPWQRKKIMKNGAILVDWVN